VDAPAEQRLADLENTLRLIGLDPREHAPLIAPLVDILLPPERAANFAPEELRRRQLAAMTALVLAGARSQPVILAFEDLHWADPTSLDLLRALADRGAQAPLLLLATARPEFRAPWSLRSHHSLMSLSPLLEISARSRRRAIRLAGGIIGPRVLRGHFFGCYATAKRQSRKCSKEYRFHRRFFLHCRRPSPAHARQGHWTARICPPRPFFCFWKPSTGRP
jgi:hypothetical protein